MEVEKKTHWENVYTTKSEQEVSWFQSRPDKSLHLITHTHGETELPLEEKKAKGVIDVGGGASVLVDCLLQEQFTHLAVLDISAEALKKSQQRLGPDRSLSVEWIVQDITAFAPERRFAVWHDRAVLHFLVNETDRAAYVSALRAALPVGGVAVIAAFAPDGPTKCSGLEIVQYDREQMCALLGEDFALVCEERETHHTPWASVQNFNYFKFVKLTN